MRAQNNLYHLITMEDHDFQMTRDMGGPSAKRSPTSNLKFGQVLDVTSSHYFIFIHVPLKASGPIHILGGCTNLAM